MAELLDRFARQIDLVPREALYELTATVIGVGAIGRQVAIQLAALGVRNLQLVDFDRVEAANVTSQGYLNSEIGLAKVTATARAVVAIDNDIRLTLVEDRFRPTTSVGAAVFVCVDSISARSAIWRNAGQRCEFWCDGRMLGEVLRIVTVAGLEGRQHYPTTLFEQTEAMAGACTARGTVYTAAVAAGLMTHQFTRWLRGQSIDCDLSLNLLASELSSLDGVRGNS
jgi:molybdopterin-synthase adenylyltransferase